MLIHVGETILLKSKDNFTSWFLINELYLSKGRTFCCNQTVKNLDVPPGLTLVGFYTDKVIVRLRAYGGVERALVG